MSNFFNFKDFVRYGTALEDAEINTEALIDSIYVGPQGELLELVDKFNLDYNCDLGITKQFTLKPGGYDKLKKAYANSVLRWDMKPKGIESIFKSSSSSSSGSSSSSSSSSSSTTTSCSSSRRS